MLDNGHYQEIGLLSTILPDPLEPPIVIAPLYFSLVVPYNDGER